MLWIIGALLLAVIAYFAFKFIESSRPLGFAKQLARAQLTSFYAFRNKYPNVPPQDLYSMVLTSRPGYDAERADNIISGAAEVAQELGEEIRFSMVVLQLAAYEYLSRTGQSPMPVMNDLRSGVTKVIPPTL
jgi:hypothetical protein